MNNTAISITSNAFEVFLPVLYALTVLLYGLAFFRDDEFARRWRSRLLLATGVVHFLYIGLHTRQHGHCLVTTPFEIMSLVAFTILATYTFIEFRTRVRETGFFLVGLAALFEFFSAVTVRALPGAPINPVLSNLGVGLHVTAAIFGFGAIAISAVYGVLYMFMYRDLKRGSFGSFFSHLPSLESLEHMSINGAIIGFGFMSAAILIGVNTLPKVYKDFSYFDPKLVATVLVWIVYAVSLAAKYILRLEGRRVIAISTGGFILALLSMAVVNPFLSSFHRFH
jgi:ABC-type uncharacterized transport system permease subunit